LEKSKFELKETTLQPLESIDHAIRVVGINGSLRDGSYTRLAIDLALQGAEEVGAQTQLIDLREYDLVFCDGKVGDDDAPPDVLRLRQEVRQAHGIILGTPEYHGSFSGVLKNALDLMGFDEFEGKMMGLVGTSGGKMGAINALNSLRMVGRALHAWVVPEQISIPEAWRMFDATGNLKDPAMEDRLKEMGRQVARFAFLHSSEQAREFLHLWEIAPANPGGGS
jgi:NAD(P)H-dependent FMN reductase